MTRATKIRLYMSVAYCVLAYGVLWEMGGKGNSFCAEAGTPAWRVGLELAIVLTLIDAVAGQFAGFVRKQMDSAFFAAMASGAFMVIALAILPAALSALRHTFVDVSCFFTEGYSIGWIYVIVPLFSIVTAAREWLLQRKVSRASDRSGSF